MRREHEINQLLDAVETVGSCAYTHDQTLRRALRRRVNNTTLVCPYPGTFARPDFWNNLDPIEQSHATIRALAGLHPSWVFTGLSAATMYGFEHGFALHADRPVFIVSKAGYTSRSHHGLCNVHLRNPEVVMADGVRVTSAEQTCIVCAQCHSFRQALAIFDSVARQGVSKEQILETCTVMGIDSTRVSRLCTYMDPLSENGGESFARAMMIELGFIVPRLQRPFANPDNPSSPYRADFSWELPDGRIIVAEYDGMRKYTMQSGLNRESIEEKVDRQLERERHLRTQGVEVIRFRYEDVTHPQRLACKLTEAGIAKRR